MKIKWQNVQFEDDLPLEQRTELLREYKETGSIQSKINNKKLLDYAKK